MKKFNPSATICFVFLGILMFLFSCSLMKPKLRDCVQKDICNNPKLKQRNIMLWVNDEKDGYITVSVNSSSFSEATMSAIRQGKNLRDISMFSDNSVNVLIETEEIIKKRLGVKAVNWTAANVKPGETISTMVTCDDFMSRCSE